MQQERNFSAVFFILKLTYKYLKTKIKECWKKILESSDKEKNPSIDNNKILENFLKYIELKKNMRTVKEKLYLLSMMEEEQEKLANANKEDENDGNDKNEIISNKESSDDNQENNIINNP